MSECPQQMPLLGMAAHGSIWINAASSGDQESSDFKQFREISRSARTVMEIKIGVPYGKRAVKLNSFIINGI